MKFQRSQQIIPQAIERIYTKVWQNIAVKAIQKVAPHQLTIEANKMFNDFAVLNSKISKESGTSITEEPDNAKKITQNYIMGTTKMIERLFRSKSEQKNGPLPKQNLVSKNGLKRIKTVSNEEQVNVKTVLKKNNFFQLAFQQNRTQQQEKYHQVLRNKKQSDVKYRKTIDNAQTKYLAEKVQKTAYQMKRFKEMKTFTYDFQGRLLSTGQKKRNKPIPVLKVDSQLTQQIQSGFKFNKKRSEPKVNTIVNKKTVDQQKSLKAQILRQKKQKLLQKQQKQHQLKKNAFTKAISPINIMEIFKNQDKISVGVIITELSSKSKVTGRTRDKDDRKNLNLLEYKDQFKIVEIFPHSRPKKIIKNAAKTTSYFRTQGNEIQMERDRSRIRTEVNDFSRKNVTSLSKYAKFRGIIRISNQKLYTQNFSQTIQSKQ